MLHPSMLAVALALTSLPRTEKQPNPSIQVGSTWLFNLLNLPVTPTKVTDTTVTVDMPLGEKVHDKETFLKFFTLISNPTEQVVKEETFGFADALTALEEGQRVKRKDWEQGKFLFLVKGDAITDAIEERYGNPNHKVHKASDSIFLHQTDGTLCPYFAVNDVLAKDWVLV